MEEWKNTELREVGGERERGGDKIGKGVRE